jgi:hypothetical protein
VGQRNDGSFQQPSDSGRCSRRVPAPGIQDSRKVVQPVRQDGSLKSRSPYWLLSCAPLNQKYKQWAMHTAACTAHSCTCTCLRKPLQRERRRPSCLFRRLTWLVSGLCVEPAISRVQCARRLDCAGTAILAWAVLPLVVLCCWLRSGGQLEWQIDAPSQKRRIFPNWNGAACQPVWVLAVSLREAPSTS